MSDINEILRKLSGADQKAVRTQRKIRQKPRELSNDQVVVQQQKDLLEKAKADKKALQLKNRNAEKSLADKENELLKVKGLQNSAKSNDEFNAHGRKISSLENEVGALETEILEMFDALEAADGKITEREKRLKTAEDQLSVSKVRITEELEVVKADFAKIQAEREEIMKSLSGDDRGRYLTAYKAHEYDAIASIGGGVCQGCYVSVRPNDRVAVEAGNTVVICSNCGRVLHS